MPFESVLITIRRRVWISSLLATAVLACVPRVSAAQGCLSGTLGDEFTADRLGFVREWIIQIPSMAPGSTLEHVTSADGLVVAVTSDGAVHAIQATSAPGGVPQPGSPLPGSLLWSRIISRAGGRLERVGIGSDLVAVSQDKDVYGLERATGVTRWRESEKNLAATGPAVIGSWVYSPNGGGMTRFAARPLQSAAAAEKAAASSTRSAGSAAQSAKNAAKKGKARKQREESLLPSDIDPGGDVAYQPVPFGDGVLWCTTAGLLVTLQPTEAGWQRLEFSLDNPPAGPPTVRNRSIFAATTNGDLARIDMPKKLTKRSQLELGWHAVLEGPAASAAFVAGDTVVVSLGDLGIAAFSAETGSRLWQTCFTGTILSAGGGRLWLIDGVGRLSSLDLGDGMRRETLCLGPFSLPLVNNQDDRLLLASPSGMLVSLAPRRAAEAELPADVDADGRPDATRKAESAADPLPAEDPTEEPADDMTDDEDANR